MLWLILAEPLPSGAVEVTYRTSFEQPDYFAGDIDGQDGWTDVSFTGAGLVQNTEGINRGLQSLRIQPAAEVARPFTGSASGVVYIDGYYRGPTVSETPEVSSLPMGTSIILFHATSGILALDGDGTGGGDWKPTGTLVSSDTMQRITIRQDYNVPAWDLYIDGLLKATGLGFKDNTINRLNGINIETSENGPGFLDDFSVTTAPPDFLATPVLFYFQSDWTRSGGNLNWDLSPLTPDDRMDGNDLLELVNRLKK